ncbi:conjugal transfer protein TraB [Salinadaptatus halalkaliphilus]|uniref:Conjugal transfer protein TraB n=1 Tax=Salinadaptatus halalkaliphilus TaxID=2419781 RepID=A0A4S3TQZ0_9EURY|nr:TraB domain-containing protein [Salinadaptatus halalkaliphilus]THE66050.1 conjugal transfer protein TraB [Salinadaptatus halalkaliphilus]
MSNSGSITLVPSVHFSPTHRRRVRATIRETKPDVVAVELDEKRFERLERQANRDPFDLPFPVAVTYTLLRTVQRAVVRLYGLDPETTDMAVAIEAAAELDTEVALIDRPIDETVSALTDRIGLETIPKVFARAQRIDPAQQARALEATRVPFSEIRHGDDVQPAIDQVRRLLPEVAEVLIDTRDRIMARRLYALARDGNDVVAVIGAGHHNGIHHRLESLVAAGDDIDATIPRRRPAGEPTRIPIE